MRWGVLCLFEHSRLQTIYQAKDGKGRVCQKAALACLGYPMGSRQCQTHLAVTCYSWRFCNI